ncbi:hypothetical protein [Flavivirga spongiicola]|uniref:6-bladed beta-propeller n=1 Tax=Flavivirga spongiicola TaxID=421621 RepID=A0ABU7XWU1_9FLAO|nr:hypothetical protein [Flavivirga sp. MEBiC05379]MDO5979426.1 hypothetical protein [Flavivirga sp. MEBiC05379]
MFKNGVFYYYTVLSILFCLLSCNSDSSKPFEDFFNTTVSTEKELGYAVEIEKIALDHIESSSYIGEIGYLKDNIAFVDYRFCWVFLFDYEGNLIDKKIGHGKGPNELFIGRISGFSFLSNGQSLFHEASNRVFVFDNNWKKIKETRINWKGSQKYGKARNIKRPSAKEPIIYSPDFGNLKFKNFNKKCYFPIYSEHSNFNGLMGGYKYYKEGRILAELDLSNYSDINILRLLGRRTPELLNYSYLPHHSTFNFDIDSKGFFYIAHEIDSLIYVYDHDFNIKYAFGVEGENMDTNYKELKKHDVKKFRELFFNDRPKRGYYSDIKVFESNDQNLLVFRSYRKSISSAYDGLQIYKNKKLIVDTEVPKGFEVKYYKNGFYYSNGTIEEEEEKISFYKLKLYHSVF